MDDIDYYFFHEGIFTQLLTWRLSTIVDEGQNWESKQFSISEAERNREGKKTFFSQLSYLHEQSRHNSPLWKKTFFISPWQELIDSVNVVGRRFASI